MSGPAPESLPAAKKGCLTGQPFKDFLCSLSGILFDLFRCVFDRFLRIAGLGFGLLYDVRRFLFDVVGVLCYLVDHVLSDILGLRHFLSDHFLSRSELLFDLGDLFLGHLGEFLTELIDIDASVLHVFLEALLQVLVQILALLHCDLALLDELRDDLLAFLSCDRDRADTCQKNFLDTLTKFVVCHFVLLIFFAVIPAVNSSTGAAFFSTLLILVHKVFSL